jgi:hypothetical protein
MIAKLFIVKNEFGRLLCENPECKSLPEFVDPAYSASTPPRRFGYLKSGSKGVELFFERGLYIYFCEGCIDNLYKKLKLVLDRNLWSFE